MVFSAIPQVITEDRASGAQVIDGSLNFDGSKVQHLTRTPTTAGNRGKWTWSGWCKHGGNISASNGTALFAAYSSNADRDVIRYGGTAVDSLDAQLRDGTNRGIYTTSKFRDTGWYHNVVTYDSTVGVKIYVNGVEQPKSNASGGNASHSTQINNTVSQYIGARNSSGSVEYPWDGEMSQVYFIDGQALGPENFGFTDPLTNTWRPKKYTGAFTRSSVNNGTNWTQSLSAGVGSLSNGANAFDGNLSTRAQTANAAPGKELTFSPPAINFTTSLEVYCDQGSNVPTATWNGNTVNPGGGAWVTVYSGSGELSSTYPLVINTETAAQYATLKGVRIDGEILIDNLNDSGANSFYLPMDGNTPIGKDQSGNGNDWKPVNFGGSVELPKATGAIPILKTNEAGTVNKPGVRTDKKTYTVTASGGNYYLDGALKPTLNAYRGGSYTFDYTGATSHPLYLSSLQDGKWNSKAYSVEFDGTGDSCSIGPSSDFTMGTGDFTIECFVQKDNNAHRGILQISDTAGGFATSNYGTTLAIGYQSGVWQIYGTGNSTPSAESASYPINAGQWYHVAYVRHNSVAKLYVDGVEVISRSDTYNFNGTYIGYGGYYNSAYLHDGKISNLRVVKGQALYTSNFTRPSTTLTTTSQGAIASNVKLICCQDSDATTAAVKPGDITVNGDSVARNESPFLYNTNGQEGVNTGTSNTTKITIPHWAADTLYYYCNAHSGMGSSINVTTDIRKADPYAWKCVLAISGGGSITSEVSPQLNVNSSAKTFTQTGTVTSSGITNFYGASTDYAANPDDGNSTGTVYSTSSQSSDFAWGAGDFTWEWWMYHRDWDNAGGNLDQVLIYQYDGGSTTNMIETYIRGHIFSIYQQKPPVNGYITIEGSNDVFTLRNNQWVHCALVREGGYYKFFRDGVYLGKSPSNTTSWGDSIIVLGRNEGNDKNGFDGLFQDIRMYGTAKYTASTVGEQAFTVPSIAPNILPDTPSGITGKTNLTKITEGAVAFDGEDSWLDIGGNGITVGTSTFTWECFFYVDAFKNYITIFDTRESANNEVNQVYLGARDDGLVYMWSGAYRIQKYINPRQWYHIALVRDSNNLYHLYVDGIHADNTAGAWTNSGSVNPLLRIGQTQFDDYVNNNDFEWEGMLSNVRITIGQALYTSNFTPPTEPLTTTSQGATSSNVKLLTCQSPTSAIAAAVAPGSSISALFNFDFTDTSFSDVSGNNIGLTNTNTVTRVTAPSNSFGITHAAEFTAGSTQKLVTASVNQNSSGAFSFDGFFYLKNVSETGYLFDARSSTYTSSYYIYYTTDSASGTATFYTPQTNFVKPVGQWFHIRATNSGVWYNDVYQIAGPGNQQFADITIGSRYTSSTYMSGYVGAFRFFRNEDLGSSSPSQYVLTSGVASNTVIKSITTSGSPSATNFNPFTDDINAIRGQESGYATLNPLAFYLNSLALSNGNLTFTQDSIGNNDYAFGNMLLNGRKIYYEFVLDFANNIPGANSCRVGICRNLNGAASEIVIYNGTGNFETLGTTDSTGASNRTYSTGDIIGLAIDCIDGSVQYFKNGIKVGTKTFTVGDDEWTPHIRVYRSTGTVTGSFNFGQKPFKFSPPDGFQPLNLSNVQPEKVIARPDQYVSATLYNGTGNTGNSVSVGFKPDLVWVKRTTSSNWNFWFDSQRGPLKWFSTNERADEYINTDSLTSFDNYGFTVGQDPHADSSTGWNISGQQHIAWCWKAGGGKVGGGGFFKDDVEYASAAAAGLTAGNVTPTSCSIGTDPGLSIIRYTATNSNSALIPHGLGRVPKFLITKKITPNDEWIIHHTDGMSNQQQLYFNTATAAQSNSSIYHSEPTTDTFAMGTWAGTNDMITYAFCDVPGFSKFGVYEGTNNPSTGAFVELGFRPAVVIIKNLDEAWYWTIFDSTRDTYNGSSTMMNFTTNTSQNNSATYNVVDFVSNGFKIRGGASNSEPTNNAATYIYAAWAEAPTVNLYGAQANAR